MVITNNKKIKEVIDNIKQEQDEKGLNDIERLKDWEKRYVLQSEQLEEETFKAEFAKEYREENRKYYESLIQKEQEKVRTLEKILKEKNENTQITLLKEQHEKEVKSLKEYVQSHVNLQYNLINDEIKTKNRAEKLEKELKEKELLIKQLQEDNSQLMNQIEVKK